MIIDHLLCHSIPNDQFRPIGRAKKTFPTNLRASISRKIRTIIGVHGAKFPDAGSFNPQPTRSNRDNRKSFRSFTLLPSFPPPRIIPAKFPFGRENLIIDVILVTTTTPPLGGVCQINKNQRKINRSPVSPEKLHKVAIPYSKVHISIQRMEDKLESKDFCLLQLSSR